MINEETDFLLPEGLRESYRILSCLKHDEDSETDLCVRLWDEAKVLVKLAASPAAESQIRNEYDILRSLESAGEKDCARFARAIEFKELDGAPYGCALVRSYIEGSSVSELVEAGSGMPFLAEKSALDAASQLLGQLERLHSRTPPLIHRDIKPQNVIVNEKGEVYLIDFGIARHESKDAPKDTVVAGTRLTAPPEQFGYRQTDPRSDLYSTGVLLRYMITGEYTADADGYLSPKLKHIVEKATRFDPRDRYQSAAKMRRDVEEAARGRLARRALALALTALLVIALSCAFFLFREKEAVDSVHFREPLIETAVRWELGKPEGELTKDDLAGVTRIGLFGRQLYGREDQFWFLGEHVYVREEAMREAGLWAENGGIESLEDLNQLPNLAEVYLYNQNITDVRALSGMNLTHLGIGYNPIVDVSPLRGMTKLKYLNICCVKTGDLSSIGALKNLETLAIAGMPVKSLGALAELSSLKEINLFGVEADFSPLADLPSLCNVTVGVLTREELAVLCRLPLTSLTVTHANGIAPSELAAISTLTSLYYYNDEMIEAGETPPDFPQIAWLDIKNVRLPSFKYFSAMPKLETLHIYASEMESFEGLEELTALKTIYCTPKQAGGIRRQVREGQIEIVEQ